MALHRVNCMFILGRNITDGPEKRLLALCLQSLNFSTVLLKQFLDVTNN